jgi:hypothetical protein
MALGDPFFNCQGFMGSRNLNRAYVNAAVAFDAFPEVALPEGFPLFRSHGQHFLKGCGGGNLLFFQNGFESLFSNGCQSVFQWVFFHAGVRAVAALDASGLVYLDSVGPQLSVNFSGRMGFINELGCAITTPGAFINVNVPGFFVDLNLQITLFSFDALDGGAGMDLDVNMPADLDQFRRYDSHGTIIGGKCFIQLRHGPANGRAFFHQVNEVAGIRQIQSGLHAGNAPAHDQYGSPQFIRHAASPSKIVSLA